MAQAINLQDATVGTSQKVNTSGDARITLPQPITRLGGETARPNDVGAVALYCELDAGTMTGNKLLKSPLVSEDYRLTVGVDTPVFDYTFNATSQDTSSWGCTFTTMTLAQSGGYLILNSGSSVAATVSANAVTRQYFALTGNAGLHIEFTGLITAAFQTGQTFYAGLGVPASSSAPPTDGLWFQYTTTGLIGVMNFNGTVTQTGTLAASITTNTNGQFKIVVTERVVEWWVNGALAAVQAIPAGQGQPFMTTALPLFAQFNQGSGVGTAVQVKIGDIHVDQLDSNTGRPYPHIQAKKGLMGYQFPPSATVGSTCNFGNGALAAASALSNTAVGTGNPVGLGGYSHDLCTLAAGTDGIVTSFQVPAGSVNITPRSLIITGVWVHSVVDAALTGGPLAFMYSLAYGHTAVSLATAETGSFVTASTKAPRRIVLGVEGCAATATAGTLLSPQGVFRTFSSPIVVNPGEFVAVVARQLGTVASAGSVVHAAGFDAHWE